jgi:hypothetical protein
MPTRRMPRVFSLYGLGIRVNRAIPGFQELPAASRMDVDVWVDGMPPWLPDTEARAPSYVSPYCDEQGRPGFRVWRVGDGAYLRLLYLDGTEFLVDRAGRHVWAAGPETATLDDTASYLLGPIMGLVLRLRGVICLHASAIASRGRAIAFVGPAGAGKSTTAAAFAGRGCPVLSDDIVPLTGRDGAFVAHPGYPRLRLWPASIDALMEAGALSSDPAPASRERRYYLELGRNGYRFQPDPRPLAAIYWLDERSADPGAPHVDGVPGVTALMRLLANTYASAFLDRALRGREFETLGRVVTRVPVRRLSPHREPAHLSRLCDVVEKDLETLTARGLEAGAVKPGLPRG